MESFSKDQNQMLSQLMFLVSELETIKKKYKKLKITHSTCDLDITNLKKENMFLALKNKKLELELTKLKSIPKLNVNDMYVQDSDQIHNISLDQETFDYDSNLPPEPLPRDHQVQLKVPENSHNISGSLLIKQKDTLNKVTDDQIVEPVKTFKPANNITQSTILRKRNSLKKVDIQEVEKEKDQFKKEERSDDYGYLVNAIQSRRPITDELANSLVESWID